MAFETVTLDLDEPIYRAARRVAEVTGQPISAVLAASIARGLPPLDDLTPDEVPALAELGLLDDAALWRAARSGLPTDEQAELEDLLGRQNAGELCTAERPRLERLLETCGRLTVRKAHAYLLLARRGYRVPPQGEASARS